MKILITLLTLFSFIYAAQIDEFAAEVKYLRNYDMAIKTAKEQNKIVMLVVVADYCPWCKKFERKTLKDSTVMTKVNENFVGIVIDKYKDQGTYPEEFLTPVIPVVFFIEPKERKVLTKTVAYMKPDEFIKNMNDAVSLYKVRKK
ncbi:MAG: thioredoxin family protein [Sulfuricurvum sp.]|nr:thioredoxin family protein [Sulfuricurvum sp.]